jgi:hypothetical protein
LPEDFLQTHGLLRRISNDSLDERSPNVVLRPARAATGSSRP